MQLCILIIPNNIFSLDEDNYYLLNNNFVIDLLQFSSKNDFLYKSFDSFLDSLIISNSEKKHESLLITLFY